MRWDRKQWAETFTGDHHLWLLEECGEVAMFKSQDWGWVGNITYVKNPVYTVWQGDEMLYSGESYIQAFWKYENERKKESFSMKG